MPDFAVVRPIKPPGRTGLGWLIPERLWDLTVLINRSRQREGQTYHGKSGQIVKGHLIECPFPQQKSLSYYAKKVRCHLTAAGRLAEEAGAEAIGFDRRIKYAINRSEVIAPLLKMPVVNGDLLQAGGISEALRQVMAGRGQSLGQIRAMAVSWRHPLVKLLAELLARDCRELIVWDQPQKSLDLWLNQLLYNTGAVCRRTSDMAGVLSKVDVVLLGDTSAGPGGFSLADSRPETIVIDIFPWLNQLPESMVNTGRVVLAEPIFRRESTVYERKQINFFDSLEGELFLTVLDRHFTGSLSSKDYRLEQVAAVQRLARQQGFSLVECGGWKKEEGLDKGRSANYNSHKEL